MSGEEHPSSDGMDRQRAAARPTYRWYQLSLGAMFELTAAFAAFVAVHYYVEPTTDSFIHSLAAIGVILSLLLMRRGHTDLVLIGTPPVLLGLYFLWLPRVGPQGGCPGMIFGFQFIVASNAWMIACGIISVIRLAWTKQRHLWLAVVFNQSWIYFWIRMTF